jgi:hypothetical protein
MVPSPQPSAPAVVERLRFTQRRAPSNKPETPYGLQVIIQTDTASQPTGLRVECDGGISEGRFFVAGQPAMIAVGQRLSEDRKAFLLSFRYPTFAPDAPVVVTLLSKGDIHVTKVEQIPPLF